jgi:hypothetical protein
MNIDEKLKVLAFISKWQGINFTNISNNCVQGDVEFTKIRTDQIKSNN